MPGGSIAAELPDLRLSVLEVADRLLARGTVVTGEATISVAGVDLIYLGLNAVLTAVENLERAGAGPVASSRDVQGERPTIPVGAGSPRPYASTRAERGMTSGGEAAGAEAEAAEPAPPGNLDLDPERIEQGLAKLVLTLVELLRQLLERQGLRRMEGGTLSDEEVERMGLAFMRLEARVREMARQFGLDPDDLNLSLGPVGDLL